ncbi:MAG: HAD family hydrolase [Eubacterium sp.]|nr:HAD family hydrolase [Eubacterium sp.]
MMKKGIIFDMDGTLWDAAENIVFSWNKTIRREKGELRELTPDDLKSVMGRTMTELAQILFPMLKEEEANALVDLCGQEENEYLRVHGGVLYPDLEGTLEILAKDYALTIVSNCQKGYIEAFLDYYQFWNYFQDIECFGNNQMGKAHNIAQVVKRNGFLDAVYVGDIQGDYDASTEAGVKFIHAAYGFGKISSPVPFIREFAELPKVVREIF